MGVVQDWETRGARRVLAGHEIFVIDQRPGSEEAEPLLILQGFPSCSFDWRNVLEALGERRRVIALDFLGYGLSSKPDRRYSLFEQADIVQALLAGAGMDRLALVTHDMGDSVGGELLARSLDGTLQATISRRVITNGSIYMDLVQLSAGQQFLLALPDETLPPEQAPDRDLFTAGIAATFGPETQPSADELDAQWELVAREGGNRILPRLIRYVEERRVHESRWTGAIEQHPSPLTVVWGDADPIAVVAMAERLAGGRADANLVRLSGIGHYPMIETPERFARAVNDALASI